MPDNNHSPRDHSPLDDAWSSFGAETKGTPMLQPTEVRRRGDRRRLQRRTGITAAALGLSLLAGTGLVFGSGLFNSSTTPDIAGTPSVSGPVSTPTPSVSSPTASTSSPPASSTAPSSTAPSSTAPSSTAPSSTAPSSTAPSSTAPQPTASSSPANQTAKLSLANLPTVNEIYRNKPGDMPAPSTLTVAGLSTASGDPDLFACDQDLYSRQSTFRASYTRLFADRGSISTRAFVIQTNSEAEALALGTEIRGWMGKTCSDSFKKFGGSSRFTTEKTLVENGATIDYGVGVRPSNEAGMGAWSTTFVVHKGDRVLIISHYEVGQDYNGVGPAMAKQDPSLPRSIETRNYKAMIERLMK